MRAEHWWVTLPLKLKALLHRGQLDHELDEELQFHLEHKIEEGIAAGLSPEDARHAALRAMEGLEQKKEEIRELRGVGWLTDFLDDVRYAIRGLERSRRLAFFVIVTLAVGIGMSASGFSMVDALIFRPYPVPQPGRVVSLVSTSHDSPLGQFSYREYLDLKARAKSYDGVIASGVRSGVGFSADPAATPRVKGGLLVSGNFFRVLGVEPRIGRGFRENEDQVPGRDAVVVLGPDFWKHEFAGDPSVVGRTVRLNGKDFTVIGVAPASFPGMQIFVRPDFYMPLAMARVFSTDRRKNFFEDRDDRELWVKARLKPGVALSQARSELDVLAKDFEREHPDVTRDRGAAVHTMVEMRTLTEGNEWKFSVIFVILTLAVLIVACTNAAALLLARARTRTREISIRLALGASRFRLVRLLLTESMILAAFGGLGGILVAYGVTGFFGTFRIPSELPATIPFRVDTRVLVACVVLSVVSAILCGLAPALQSTRADLIHGLKTADVDLPGRRRLWGRNALVVAQVATSLMLISAAFLMARSFRHSVLGTTGFATDHLLMARFDPRLVQYDPVQTQQFYETLTDRLRAAPGVVRVGLTQDPPLGFEGYERLAFVPEGFDMPRDRASFTSQMDTIDEGYFDAMGIAIRRGRAFRSSDAADQPRVAIVNDHFAKHYWPNGDAVGRRIRLDRANGTPVEIVGVAQTIRYRDQSERPSDFVYLPLAQHPIARMVVLVRTSDDPGRHAQPVRDVVHALDPNLPVSEMRTYEELYRYSTVEGPRFAVEIAGLMGAIALLLSIAGLYGLVSYNVSRRVREIGIRMAVGAQPSDVVRMVMGKGLELVGAGTLIGIAMGFGVERLINTMLFDAGRVDLVAFLVVVPAMLLITMLAAYVPARRAARIQPTEALRYE
jgi:predicted permease